MSYQLEIQKMQPARVLGELTSLLENMECEDYKRLLPVLSNQSIGAHCRHVIEFYQCLRKGIEVGMVCYEERKRDVKIETDRLFAIEMLNNLIMWHTIEDKPLLLQIGTSGIMPLLVLQSSLLRELHYVSEHSIHHFALIKIGVQSLGYQTMDNFGTASSTIKFRNQCAS